MPELAEVKIMSDFINSMVAQDPFFESMEKSPVSKVKTEDNPFEGGVFTMHAKSRGKELLLHMEMIGGDIDGAVTKNLLMGMGMSGSWIYMRNDSPNLEKALKHGHLRFRTTKGNWLIMYDIRRFAKWKWTDGWNKGRGPCPLTEFNDFQLNLLTRWKKDKAFGKGLNEILMNQSYFNGVGNYLRAEILYRLDIDPFQPINQISLNMLHELIKITHECVSEAYILGGGQLRDWKNPVGVDAKNFDEWVQCYGKLASCTDKTGRRFWYNPKWENSEHLT
jgi:endonuclease VIII-like 1